MPFKVYVASKSRHWPWWAALRAAGIPIVASWVDAEFNHTGAEPGHTIRTFAASRRWRTRSRRSPLCTNTGPTPVYAISGARGGGKGLTDPVSQARFIGPECFGSGSANLPFITSPSIAEEFEKQAEAQS